MLIYLELLFILNYWIDFLLLITTNIIMKYKTNYYYALFSSLIGALSTFLVFIDNDLLLSFLKIIICIIMQLIMNGYKGLKTLFENVFYFYLVSIILAGALYLINEDSLGIKERYFLLIIFTPIILYINRYQIKKLNNHYNECYKVKIINNGKEYVFNAFLDTGNNLYDQYKKRPISIIYSKKIKFDYDNGLLVPIETANGTSLLKCIIVDELIIENKIIKNAVIGLSSKKINIQDINMLLHKDIIGGYKWFYYYC